MDTLFAAAGRFWPKADQSKGPDSCWTWQSTRMSRRRYGQFRNQGRQIGAHRMAVLLDGRALADGDVVDHLCRNTLCVNPRHLEIVSPGENTRRGLTARGFDTHCARGHAYDEANTYYRADGSRVCRACNLASCQRRRARLRTMSDQS